MGPRPTHQFSRIISKLVFTILALICLILGCLYKSIITTDMIKPIPGTIPYHNYSQLQDFTFITLPAKDLVVPRQRNVFGSKKGNQSGQSLFRPTSDLCRSFELGSYIERIRNALQYLGSERNQSKKVLEFYLDILNRIRIYEYEEDALARISKCNQKNAYVGDAEEIEDFLKFNKKKVKLGKGRDKFLAHNKFWIIPYYAGGFVHRRMAQLLSSGIYHIWEKIFYRKTREELDISLKRTIETNQSLDTNLGVLFKITGLGLTAGIFVFCIEILFSMVPKLFWMVKALEAAVVRIKAYIHVSLQKLLVGAE